jgi:hypothetical protein
MLYRLSTLRRVGPFVTKYKIAGDYEHHFRCVEAGLKALCVPRTVAEFDLGGSSGDNFKALAEFRAVHREFRHRLPAWVAVANELRWDAELAKIVLIKAVRKTPLLGVLRPLWNALHRHDG